MTNDSQFDIWASLKVHPGWQLLIKWIQESSQLKPSTMGMLAKGGEEQRQEALNRCIEANARMGVIVFVETEFERAKKKNQQQADNQTADRP
jgi:hypothetical protein